MQLMTKEQRAKLLKNGARSDEDHAPVVKWFTPDAQCTWLISELDPEDPDRAFGLCDLGMGFPELGAVLVSEVEGIRGALGLPVERDLYVTLDRRMSVYAEAARMRQRITTAREDLDAAAWLDAEVKKCEADPEYLSVPVAELVEADDFTAAGAYERRS